MSGRTISLGGVTFPSKKAACEHIGGILHRHRAGDELAGDELGLVLSSLLRHPHAVEKLSRCLRVLVDGNTYRELSFWLEGRGAGVRTDFSYKKCFRPAATNVAEFSAACRHEVAPDIVAFKSAHFQAFLTCPITGAVLTWQTTDVDHAPPNTFAALVREFIATDGVDLAKVAYDRDGMGPVFADRELAARWLAFHRDHAALRLVSTYANRILLPIGGA